MSKPYPSITRAGDQFKNDQHGAVFIVEYHNSSSIFVKNEKGILFVGTSMQVRNGIRLKEVIR